MSRYCPTCGRLEDDDAEAKPARNTLEFPAAAVTAVMAETGDAAPATPTPMPYAGSDRCSWCGKHQGTVKKLITGPGVQICDECVAFCALILRDELQGG